MLSCIFERARIYDGDGGPPFVTDLALVGDRIALIGDLREREAVTRIDCGGLALAPGFIDVHSHSDENWLADGRATGKIVQGVTTEITGNCGSSVAPLVGYARERKAADVQRVGLELTWSSFEEFFAEVERSGVALNAASLVGLGTTRACVSGPEARRLEREELETQRRLVRESVEQGAVGVSSGLIYEPSRYADVEELAACSAAAREGGAPLYASHIRDEGDELLAAVDEALTVGARADVAVQLSHHKAAWRRNWGKVHRSLERIDHARRSGSAVACDAYPYLAMWTDLDTILPDDLRDGGPAQTLERLSDPARRTAALFALRLRYTPEEWHDMLITDVGGRSARNEEIVGLRVDEIAVRRRLSPERAALDLLVEEELTVQCAFFAMNEDDVATVLSADFCAIGSDASARGFTGPTARGKPHPRTYGCFPRVFKRFVRRRPAFTTEEAVRRMTSLPARIFGLRGRGRIAVGGYADLVVFDPEQIADRATYEEPYQAPDGIRHVSVNGEFVVRDGEPIAAARPGRVLRGGGPP
ncbi:MAG: amidohydrolase family protein [Candidatus Eremiobacteraeota bacterium]|nr:amidohydrolase family protein [Candidatus Eremiobacteraeota bacterium]MBV8354710.1 amidohydrolase family protein [Candidatus Eremiobacteraeota bacterium]